MPENAIIALGSNLAQPALQLEKAFECLQALPETRLISRSSLYKSSPQGPQDQDDYINAAAQIETSLSPAALLLALQGLEQDFGRVKTRHWGERIIDLDLIFYAQQSIKLDEPDLIVPHPRAYSRDFVLVPILEIAPTYICPDGKTLASYLDECERHNLNKLPNA